MKQTRTNMWILGTLVVTYIPFSVSASFSCLSETGQRVCFLTRCLLSTLVLPWILDSPLENRQPMQFANLAHFALNLLQAQVLHVHSLDLILATLFSLIGFTARVFLYLNTESLSELTDMRNPETLVLIVAFTFAALTVGVLMVSISLSKKSKTSQKSQSTKDDSTFD